MQILVLLGMYFDAVVVFVTFIQIGSGHTVNALGIICPLVEMGLTHLSPQLQQLCTTAVWRRHTW